ncbi:MAG: histidine--tRNA ligase [Cytophagaceae bacterium]|nr:histidine--tRNA ligase [Cytophagaceae bacterium]
MSNKPGIPRGTRDFGPEVMSRRNYLFDTIRSVFQTYGFQPLETPAMEKLEVLTGKYGEEGDKLIFKVLNSGNFMEKMVANDLQEHPGKVAAKISEKALRYDLTVPFARYVAIHKNELNLPFRRYQIQPVWRGDNPQFGRYREFYQCDADVVGTDSLVCEAELIALVNEVMNRLHIRYELKINNRKILTGLSEKIGAPGKEADFCVAIDKLDKIGKEGVEKELLERGFSDASILALQPLLTFQGSNEETLQFLNTFLAGSEVGKKGLEELETVFQLVSAMGCTPNLVLDLTLARGLSYYTGAIMEVKALDVSIGSISGGGRYDNLTGLFGVPGLSGVGISFGIDRIYDVLEKLNEFPDSALGGIEVMIGWFDEDQKNFALSLLYQLRREGIHTEMYPDKAKIKKQFEYADRKKAKWVLVIGSDEMASGNLTVKNMLDGKQDRCTLDEFIARIKQ